MKGKVLTSWSLMWLLVTVLFVAGGALNLSQRALKKLPPTDGVIWTKTDKGIFAERVIPGMAGSRAGLADTRRVLPFLPVPPILRRPRLLALCPARA